jgi:hypothetical protein
VPFVTAREAVQRGAVHRELRWRWLDVVCRIRGHRWERVDLSGESCDLCLRCGYYTNWRKE